MKDICRAGKFGKFFDIDREKSTATMPVTQESVFILFIVVTAITTVRCQSFNVTSVESLLTITSPTACTGTATENFIVSFGNSSTLYFSRMFRFSFHFGSYYNLKNLHVNSPDVSLTFTTSSQTQSQYITVEFAESVANRVILISFQYEFNALVSTTQGESLNVVEFGYVLAEPIHSIRLTIQLPQYSDLDYTQLKVEMPSGFTRTITSNLQTTITGNSEGTALFSIKFPMKVRKCNNYRPSEKSRRGMRLALGLALGLGFVVLFLAFWIILTVVIYLGWGHHEKARKVMTGMWIPCMCVCLLLLYSAD